MKNALKKERSCGVECCENATELKHLCPDCLSEYYDAICTMMEPDLIMESDHADHEVDVLMAEKLKFQRHK